MNRALALLFAALALVLPGTAALAQADMHPGARVVARISWVEEWDPARGQWVRIDESPASIAPAATKTVILAETVTPEPVRFIAGPAPMTGAGAGLAQYGGQYGPFRVLDARRAALVGSTDAASPAAFRAMLAAHPGLEVLEFVDAPGTSNDIANLALGRAIRAAGLATYVPRGGSARSGAVELFLAGTQRRMDTEALFAVHSWRDQTGREPADFAPDAPENRLYLDYYAEMGMTSDEAAAFYAMTNSVPHHSALWLKGGDMARWVAPEAAAPRARQLPGLPAPVMLAALPAPAPLAAGARASLAAIWGGTLAPAPQIAYADCASWELALLDSGLAFP
jgi:hypothetical protein